MKSKEALKRLKVIVDKELNTGSKSYEDLQEFWNYKDPLKIIEDLVERDTPYKIKKPYIEKPIHKGDLILKESHCKCKNEINNGFQFCPYCGQRLDWSVNVDD